MHELARQDEAMTALVLRAQAGDSHAFRELVEQCYHQIHRWALGRVRDADDADDVTQEVLVRLHRHLPRYRGRARFTTWLYQITRNAAIDHDRKQQRRASLAERHLRLADPPVSVQDEQRLERDEMLAAVRAAFERLPTRQREVFDLVDLQGHAAVEAAALLDMKPVTARAHLFKARRAVRRAVLEQHGELLEEGTP